MLLAVSTVRVTGALGVVQVIGTIVGVGDLVGVGVSDGLGVGVRLGVSVAVLVAVGLDTGGVVAGEEAGAAGQPKNTSRDNNTVARISSLFILTS